jgi:hypothetical protein
VEIAKRHLIPGSVRTTVWSRRVGGRTAALEGVIRRYTREAGVRSLEREIAKLARKAVKEILMGKKQAVTVTAENLEEYLGVPKFRYGEAELEDQVGVVTGLAWTEVGGEILTVEGVMMPGKGKMSVTGNLRDVMKESIQAANAYVRSRSLDFGISSSLFERKDIHVHVPEGATPKDGPSAGVAMVTAIVSVMTGIPVRKDVAMTGEITRGRVLPSAALREAAGGAQGRHQDSRDPGGERQRSGRDRRRGEVAPQHRAGLAHGRRAEGGSAAAAQGDHAGGGYGRGGRGRGQRAGARDSPLTGYRPVTILPRRGPEMALAFWYIAVHPSVGDPQKPQRNRGIWLLFRLTTVFFGRCFALAAA